MNTARDPGAGGGRIRSVEIAGFTILELLVSTAVFVVILVLALSVISQTGALWRQSTKTVEAFQSARAAFETLTRTLTQATLNGYWDYEYSGVTVRRYRRNSELNFVIGSSGQGGLPGTPGTGQAIFFQAGLGRVSDGVPGDRLPELLTEAGFFVEYGSDAAWLPTVLGADGSRWRYRLFQVMENAEDVDVYLHRNSRDWISWGSAFPLADNVIALVALPRRSAAEELVRGELVTGTYDYDTRAGESQAPLPVNAHQLPPLVELAMIAVSEDSMARLSMGSSPPAVIQSALAGRLENPDRLQADLQDIEDELIENRLDVRIFSTTVALRESKWSEY